MLTDKLNSLFKIQQSGSSIRTEIMAGLTTFITMAYIIFVNPSIMTNAGMPFGPVMVATCLASAFATFLMAFLANYPIGLSTGMGLNTFFAFTVVGTMGISWQMALAAVFIEGLIFIALTLTRLRESVVNGIPQCLKIGISTGIGFYIILIGLQNCGLVVQNSATMVTLGDLTSKSSMLALFGLAVIVGLECRRVRGAILWGIAATTALSVAVGLSDVPEKLVSLPPSIAPLFLQLDFSQIGDIAFWGVVFTFFFVDFFDTVGTLVGVSLRSGLLDDQGRLPRAKEALMADAVGTVAGSVLGVSTVTSFIESASGVEQGGRTGLTALVVAILFTLSIFFSPLVGIVPSAATAPALVMVGIYMIVSLRELNFSDFSDLVPACVAIFSMPYTYSIGNGIEFGCVSYTVTKVLSGKGSQVSPVMWLLTLFFTAKETPHLWLPVIQALFSA